MTFHVPESRRITSGKLSSTQEDGNNGAFFIPYRHKRKIIILKAIASEGCGWEHVSVSLHDRTPTWGEMDFVKNKFWDDDDLVVQMHVPRKDWVNDHPYCLHLWRLSGSNEFCPRPPTWMVGIKNSPEDKQR